MKQNLIKMGLAVGLLVIVILGVVSYVKSRTISKLDADIIAYKDTVSKQKTVEQSLRVFAGQLAAERDLIKVEKEQAEKEKLDWELKFYKQARRNEDCTDKVNRARLNDAPDDEQGRILYDNAAGYTTEASRQPASEANRKRVVVQ